jgi:hypothetical protein
MNEAATNAASAEGKKKIEENHQLLLADLCASRRNDIDGYRPRR